MSAVIVVGLCLGTVIFILIYSALADYKPRVKPVMKCYESLDRSFTKSLTEVLLCNIVGHKTIEVNGPTMRNDELGCARCCRLYTTPGHKYDRFFDKINTK